MDKARQAIHTYPFKYRPMTAQEVFRPQRAAIYLHVPFCSKKCHFCDFVVRTNSSEDLRQRYVDALCREITLFDQLHPFGNLSVDAIYIGGGTPSLLTEPQLIRIIETCRSSFLVQDDAEITLEFEPVTVPGADLGALTGAGVTRASMGVQSFDDALLAASNRSHQARDVYQALASLRAGHITNINIDLIYPLPGMTWSIWESTVSQALALRPAAVSLYALEIWPGTPYGKLSAAGELGLPGPAAEVGMYRYAARVLEDAGYSAESVNGYVDRNLAPCYSRYLEYYWRLFPLIGFGVSARSAMGERLWRNCNSLAAYLDSISDGRLPVDLGCVMTKQQEMRRFMIRGLKACTVSKSDFESRFGVEMRWAFGSELTRLAADGAITENDESISLTLDGRAFAPNVYKAFYTEADLSEAAAGEVTYGVTSWGTPPSAAAPSAIALPDPA
jgi:oxygen-independent coproporphyrinogen-3 oxidase